MLKTHKAGAAPFAHLLSHGFDFESTFPPPDDAAFRRAGRQGVLDQKPSAEMSDGDWVAFQHREWLGELLGALGDRDYLRHCLQRYCVAETGQAPRSRAAWTGAARRMGLALVAAERDIAEQLAEYERHFGHVARRAFHAHALSVHAQAELEPPQQASLF